MTTMYIHTNYFLEDMTEVFDENNYACYEDFINDVLTYLDNYLYDNDIINDNLDKLVDVLLAYDEVAIFNQDKDAYIEHIIVTLKYEEDEEL